MNPIMQQQARQLARRTFLGQTGLGLGAMALAGLGGRASAAAQADPLHSFPPPDPSVFGLSTEDHAWVQRRQTPHPGKPYTQVLDFDPARVASVPRTFINCTQPPLATIDISRQRMVDAKFWEGAWLPGASVVEMATGHDPMVSDPQGLARILLTLPRS